MERSIKLILFIIITLAVINLLYTFFGNNSIRSIRQDLKTIKLLNDSALLELNWSRRKIDSIKQDIVTFRSYISDIQKTVELGDLEKRVREEKELNKIKMLTDRIKGLRLGIDNDSLPDVDVRRP